MPADGESDFRFSSPPTKRRSLRKSARDVGVLLKSILRYSAKKLDCTSPGLAVELPAYRRKQIDIFYPDEIQRLAQKIMDKPTTAGIGILLTLNTGLRLGELCALQYKDIDLRNGVLHITKTVQRIRSGDCTLLDGVTAQK